ncbi:hypothetical protein COP05_10815 [Dermabacter jinjuensis]|uniref:Uncharacterized protein n=1 Tax=Dermabacter jinjuensis TaxID=1667168 RepID=A0ABN5DQF1_9MICO|nr:hypothetical protein COP05_10815 [Dermabacter jinjuensis]
MTVGRTEPHRVVLDEVVRATSRIDDAHGILDDGAAAIHVPEHVAVGRKQLLDRGKLLLALILDVDEQLERAVVAGEHVTAVGAHERRERLHVELLEGAAACRAEAGVAKQDRAAFEPHVRLNRAKALSKGIPQRVRVQVVVVGVSASERALRRPSLGRGILQARIEGVVEKARGVVLVALKKR